MKNIKGDILWAAAFLICVAALIIVPSRAAILAATDAHPYISGFVKFFLLATMGDLIGLRITNNKWTMPHHLFFKACVWGLLGMLITLAFSIFMLGAAETQTVGKLPFAGVPFATAFFGSLTMNATFGPMMYIYHKFGDYVVDCLFDRKISSINSKAFAASVDWTNMVSFFWMRTCLFIWIPLHTLVFLLPPEYRVIASAFLSILLGVIVAASKRMRPHDKQVVNNSN